MALAAAILLAVTHLLARHLRFLDGVPRHWLLSAFGGVSVAYVFVHLLPELASGQQELSEHVPWLSHHAYLLALLGLLAFFAVERHSRRSRTDRESTTAPAFATSIGAFALYNGVVGALLVHRAEHASGWSLWGFAIALALHFVVNDWALRGHHRERYDRVGRWVLALAVLAGWGLATVVSPSEAVLAVPVAFLAGGITLNVLKEELPSEQQSRMTPLLLGALSYAVLLVAVA